MKDAVLAFFAIAALSVWGGSGDEKASAKKDPSWIASWLSEEKSAPPARDLISSAAREYQVPAWYLESTWKVESNLLEGESGTSKNWPRASDLAKSGSACEYKRGREWCQKQWNALQEICEKTSTSGDQVCDPETVRTSWAFAMGPMQILPTNILKVSEGGNEWTGNAADFDGDGAVNPLSLPDAMAMAAKISRRFHDSAGHTDDLEGWLRTTDKYLGGESSTRRAKILEHAEEWCESHECGSYHEEIASR